MLIDLNRDAAFNQRHPATRWTGRPNVVWISLTISIITGLLSVVLVQEFAIRSAAVPGVLGILSGSALIVAIATMKRVEYARFCSDGYGSVVLNVARSGPEHNQFDSFVHKLVSQIEYAQESGRGAETWVSESVPQD